MNPLEADLMSLDRASPTIAASHGISEPDDMMSIAGEKQLGADDSDAMLEKLVQVPSDLEVIASGYNHWHIEDWSALSRREHSPVWTVGDHRWRLLLFPHGNTAPDTVAAYLEALPADMDFDSPADQQRDWACCAVFAIVLWNRNDPTIYHTNFANHRFNKEETDWGFSRLYDIRKLGYNHEGRDRPLLEHGELMISSYVKIVKDPTGVLWHNFNNYDSKAVTGMVGLKNQGATCYMNSLLQSLYFTTYFRKAVYQIPTDNDDPTNSIALALQRIFYQLAKSNEPASTLELTQSFGWNSLDAFMQHDVQEFNRVLQDNLEGKMKKTQAENALSRLFVGKMKSYIKCVNVEYESAREEEFWDIQLNVKGMKNLRESFADYVQVETLDGDNKYFAEGYGLQDAKKGVIFQAFPPVLHLQLKRFEYDIERDAMVKINDRHEFPLEIDLKEFLDEASVDPAANYNYKLHGVLVHSGDLHGGHYYALLKPSKDSAWYRFDDDRVTPCTLKEVLDENFGGAQPPLLGRPQMRHANMKRYMNAYMLVYVKEDRQADILGDVADEDIPRHVSERIERELAEEARLRKEREEMHLYLNLRTIRAKDFEEHSGFDLTSFSPETMESRKVLKTMTYGDFKEQTAASYGIDSQRIRHWVMVNRQNKTIRPDTAIGNKFDVHTLAELRDEFGPRRNELMLYLEILDDEKLPMAQLVDGSQDNTHFILFVKYFDVDRQTLRGLAVLYMHKQDKVDAVLEKPIVKQLASTIQAEMRLFEEIKPGMIEPLRPKMTFQQAEIVDGDIVCVQRVVPETERLALVQSGKFATAPEYYDFVNNKITIRISPRSADATPNEKFELVLSRKMTYDTIVQRIGERLSVDPACVRLCTVNPVSGQPKTYVKAISTLTLATILQPAYLEQPSDQLMYEVLEMSLREFESKKLIKVSYLPEGITKEVAVEVLIPKTGNVGDALQAIRAKLQFAQDSTKQLVLYETSNHKYQRELPMTYPVISMNDFATYYVEECRPVDQRTSEDDRLVTVVHFQKDVQRTHGIPFRLWLKDGEFAKDLKRRLMEKTGYKEDELKRMKLCIVSHLAYSKPNYLDDDDVPYESLRSPDDSLGIDHIDKTVKPRQYGDASIRIKG